MDNEQKRPFTLMLVDDEAPILSSLKRIFQRSQGSSTLHFVNDDSKENKVVEIKLNGPKNQFFCKEKARSFEAGTDAAVEGLRRQLKKHKEKALAH